MGLDADAFNADADANAQIRAALETVLVKDKRIKVPDADPIREVELAIELRGPKSMRSELWGLALMLKSRADTLLAEWPEIETEAEMRCPSCLSSGSTTRVLSRQSWTTLMPSSMYCWSCDQAA